MVEVYKKLGQGENQFDYRKVPAIWEDLHLKDDVQKNHIFYVPRTIRP